MNATSGRPDPGGTGSLGDRERTGGVAQLAAQRKLPEHGVGVECLRRDLTARREHAERQRRVEPRSDLSQERRREVGGDPALREVEPRVEDRRADPVPRLAHSRVPEPNDRERGQAGADVDLDPHLARIDTVDRERRDACEHASRRYGERCAAWVPARTNCAYSDARIGAKTSRCASHT